MLMMSTDEIIMREKAIETCVGSSRHPRIPVQHQRDEGVHLETAGAANAAGVRQICDLVAADPRWSCQVVHR